MTTAAAKKERERKRKRRAICRALTDRGFKAKERSSMSLLKEEERRAMSNIRSDITRYRAYILRDWALP